MDEYYRKITDKVSEIRITEAKDADLDRIRKERSLGLSLEELNKIVAYFKKEQRYPTDVELEALAQSWSEHCCYKTSRPILERTVLNTDTPKDLCIVSEDAAVVDFDKEHGYVVALESHNHPSALDPYGGAATGIGGILRDVVCMGGQPIALIDPIFFGPLDYPEEKLPPGTKHPKYLFRGVVSGIADYGNRVGIPTVSGLVEFDESYVGNCLVNVGCIGFMRKDKVARSIAGNVGDVYIVAGGKTGRDGIHGVTFASAELGEKSESDIPAVQLGYAIMKEPLMHACLEVNEKGLLTGMKDFGGGGLSCVSAEMAYSGGKGATVYLDKVPLKQDNMAPWEIWVSESQERMMLSVKPENAEKVLAIFDYWDVPAAIVGIVDDSKRIKAVYKGATVLDLDLEFLIKGVRYERPYTVKELKEKDIEHKMPDLSEAILKVLNSPRVGSRESVIRRYDHEVRGNTILKPMQGVIGKQSHGDAAVIKPLQDSYRGLAITCAVNPKYCKIDAYWGAMNAMDETIRNLVAVNSRPHTVADCLNYANPEKPERLGELVRACDALQEAANAFCTPFVSGNVSLYNEGALGPAAPTPTILGVGILKDVRKAVSSDLKKEGNLLYLVGETKKELAGSEYYNTMGYAGGYVPKADVKKTKEHMEQLLYAMDHGLVKSCHDLSEGGLVAAAAEMAFGGDMGLALDLAPIKDLRTDHKLFSESNGRWLIEVEPKDREKIEKALPGAKKIGRILKEKQIKIRDAATEIALPLDVLRERWETAVEKEK